MPKMTPEERAELEARLAADNDDDDDDEIEYGHSDGSYIRGRRRHVEAFAAARGVQLRPSEGGSGGGEGGQGAAPKSGTQSRSGGATAGGDVRRFHGRRA